MRREAEREKSTAASEEETVAVAAAEKAEVEKAASEKAEADNAAAEKAKAEKVATYKAEALKVAAEKAEAENAATEKLLAEKAAVKSAEIKKAVAENAPAEKAVAESVTTVSAADVASTSCWGTQQPTPSAPSDPLPVCHYCCHRGSGDYPVHYYQQCLCDDSPCTCLCYCSGAQLEHKHRVFPSRFWGKSCDPVNVPKARAFADERTERLRGYCPNCTSENCVRYMKEDGLNLPLET